MLAHALVVAMSEKVLTKEICEQMFAEDNTDFSMYRRIDLAAAELISKLTKYENYPRYERHCAILKTRLYMCFSSEASLTPSLACKNIFKQRDHAMFALLLEGNEGPKNYCCSFFSL